MPVLRRGPREREGGHGPATTEAPAAADAAVGGDSYRARLVSAASARGVPLATIVTTVIVIVLVVDANVLALVLLWVLRTVLLYCVIAGFIALVLAPAVRLVMRIGLPHGVAVVAVFVVALLVVSGIVALFTTPLVSAIEGFAKEVPKLITQAEKGKGRIGHLLVRFHLQRVAKKDLPKLANDIKNGLRPAQALSAGTVVVSTLTGIGIIAILSLFMLLEMDRIGGGVLELVGPRRAQRLTRVYRETSRAVSGYIVGTGVMAVLAGIVMFVFLIALGVPYPALLGFWVALVDMLPLVGGLIAGVPVVIIAFIHSLPAGIVLLIAFLAYQQIQNHLLSPLIMSRTVRMNPLWVLLAVLVGATLGDRVGAAFGAIAGALIGIPAGGAIQVVVRELRRDRPAPLEIEPAEPGGVAGVP